MEQSPLIVYFRNMEKRILNNPDEIVKYEKNFKKRGMIVNLKNHASRNKLFAKLIRRQITEEPSIN